MKRSARIVYLTMFGASLVGGLLATAGVAQTVNLGAANSADFKVVYATAQDVAEGKQVAETMCAGCHGINGISKQTGVPNIAGQRPVYLHLEMKVYQAGGRGNKIMTNTVKYMNDDAIMKVSAYYASLEPAEPSSGGSAKAAPAKPSAVSAGKAAAAGCAGCHGEAGISKTPGMPSLIGVDPKYFIAAINAYKGGQRKHDMMKTLVSGLSETDLNNIALYYALQKPGKAQTPAPGNAAAGKTAAAGCVGCHGRRRRQRQSGDTQPRRTGGAIFCRCDARLQGRIAQRRDDERSGKFDRREPPQRIWPPTTPARHPRRPRSASP